MSHSLRSIYLLRSTSERFPHGFEALWIRPSLTSGFFHRENSKLEREIILPTPTRANIFAVPLEDLMGYDGEKDGIPRVIKDSIQYLRETGTHLQSFPSFVPVTLNEFIGLEEEGLFRRSPNLTLLNQVTDAYDRGMEWDHVVSHSLKLCFRSRCITGYVQRSTSRGCADQEILARPPNTNFLGEDVSGNTTMPRSE